MIDFHTHILPKMDDGSKSIQQSCHMIKILKKQNIDACVATPHFFCNDESIDSFISRRTVSYNSLMNEIKGTEFDFSIFLGAEVYLDPILIHNNDINKLCINGSKYILIEMPYSNWPDGVFDCVSEIIDYYNVQPIIAHVERYFKYAGFEKIQRLMDLGVLGQINSNSIINRSRQRDAFKLIKNGYIHLLGSDCHNTTFRSPILKDAYDIIEKKLGTETLNVFKQNSHIVIGNE